MSERIAHQGEGIEGARVRWINGGQRLHLQHGPIELLVALDGSKSAISSAYARAIDAFPSMLPSLVSELTLLRRQIQPAAPVSPTGRIARQMFKAARVYANEQFITPMAAVAGSVADELLAVILSGQPITRASVNNGGDIALYLRDGEVFNIGICDSLRTGRIASTVCVTASDRIGGIATSGWQGRSHSLGIADAVTVLAHSAAAADCAATIIANAIDLPASPKISRAPANELFPDSDLGSMPVTVDVDTLTPQERMSALSTGQAVATKLLKLGHIQSAFLSLQGQGVVVKPDESLPVTPTTTPPMPLCQSLSLR
ncbi:MAG: UPF0280 family protein [Burkholderiaceae bacterium]